MPALAKLHLGADAEAVGGYVEHRGQPKLSSGTFILAAALALPVSWMRRELLRKRDLPSIQVSRSAA